MASEGSHQAQANQKQRLVKIQQSMMMSRILRGDQDMVCVCEKVKKRVQLRIETRVLNSI